MARLKRSLDEQGRIGVPEDAIRIDILERLVTKLLTSAVSRGDIQANDSDRQELSAMNDKLDQLDIDFPDAG